MKEKTEIRYRVQTSNGIEMHKFTLIQIENGVFDAFLNAGSYYRKSFILNRNLESGLTDINKKKIFEGDILQYKDKRKIKTKFIIKRNFIENEYKGECCNGLILPSNYEEMEIIGNIYENKIKGDKK